MDPTAPASDHSNGNGMLSNELKSAAGTPPVPSQVVAGVASAGAQQSGGRMSGGSAEGSNRASGSTTPNGPNNRSPSSKPVAVPAANTQRSVPAQQYAPLNANAQQQQQQQAALEAQYSSPSNKPNGLGVGMPDYLPEQTSEFDGTAVSAGKLDDPTPTAKPMAIDRRVQRASPNQKPQAASVSAAVAASPGFSASVCELLNSSAAMSNSTSAAADARVRELEALVAERDARVEELERTNQAQLSEFK